MEQPLSGKTALVTGGALRLGRAICLELARAGADVVIHYNRSGEAAEALALEIHETGRRAWIVSGNFADEGGSESVFAMACARAGPLDLLVNSASVFEPGSLLKLTKEDLNRQIQINAWGPFCLSRLFAGQNHDGCVINLLDSKVVQHDAQHVAYHLSKRMLFTLTRLMAVELAPQIRVNAVAPGLILPPPGEDESYVRNLAHANLLQRWGSAEQIGRTVVFLACADFITGQVVFVDGGQHMRGQFYG